jgi:hypothetical protein
VNPKNLSISLHDPTTAKTMAITDEIRNVSHSCMVYLPEWMKSYATIHMDTIPKFLNHVLMVMAGCNLFLVLSSWSISIMFFFVAFLLSVQNTCVFLMLNHGKLVVVVSPRFLAPTEFMVGVSLGISIGGTILACFMSLFFGRIHDYCDHLNEEHKSACGDQRGTFAAIWWWSSMVFWLEVLTCLLLAAGRQEISQNHHQYQAIDGNNGYSMDNQQQPQNGGGGGGFVGNYANIPDVQTRLSQPTNNGFQQQQQQQQPLAHTVSI